MTTLIKLIITTVLSLTLLSCNFDINLNAGVNGNGEVVTETRTLNSSFTAIKATEGIDVYLTQSDTESINVEADENLQNLILTDIEDGILKIHTKEVIGYSSSKKVYINFKNVTNITSTSGSEVYSKNTINTEHLDIKSTSGSNMKLDINTSVLNCDSSSGSDMRVSGKTAALYAEASSGSNIKAADLMAETSNIKATSGANITINTSKTLTARATSGGDIRYYGNPTNVTKNNSSSGSIKQQ